MTEKENDLRINALREEFELKIKKEEENSNLQINDLKI